MIINKRSSVFITFITFIMFINPVLALGCADQGFMGSFQVDTNVTLTETCPTCTFINITLKDTTSTIVFSNQPMTLSGGIFSFEILSGNHSQIGTYFVEGHSNLDNPFKACYVITNIKQETTTSESLLYLGLIFISVLVFLFSLWASIVIPFTNKQNELGRVLSITWFKYFKIMFMTLTYGMLVWIMNLSVSITQNLVSLTQFNGFFAMIFNVLLSLAFPLFVITFIFFNMSMLRDIKLNRLLQRGITPR